MFGFLKIKTLLIGMLVASPAAVYWADRGAPSPPWIEPSISSVSLATPLPVAESTLQVPVEVITNGSAPQWVYVQVGNQAVPEPGMASLLALTTLLLAFRRQRG